MGVTTFPSTAVCIPKTSIGAGATRHIPSQRKTSQECSKMCLFFLKKSQLYLPTLRFFPPSGTHKIPLFWSHVSSRWGLQPSQADSNPSMFGCFPSWASIICNRHFHIGYKHIWTAPMVAWDSCFSFLSVSLVWIVQGTGWWGSLLTISLSVLYTI